MSPWSTSASTAKEFVSTSGDLILANVSSYIHNAKRKKPRFNVSTDSTIYLFLHIVFAFQITKGMSAMLVHVRNEIIYCFRTPIWLLYLRELKYSVD